MKRPILKYNINDIGPNSKGIGLSIDFSKKEIFSPTFTTKETLKNNFMNLILTNKGERIFNNNFGTDIVKNLFDNNYEGIEEKIKHNIIYQTSKYIPEIKINNINIYNKEHNINIIIEYYIPSLNEEDKINIEI